MSVITVTNLGKAYKQYPNRWSRLAEWLSPIHKKRHTLKWVLQDISFTVNPGEAIGIIGINGAGKSTLLKMITGTTKPTTGRVEINGRVSALIELGMGFHPEFTGRQNCLMAGQLLGYSVEKINALMPEIEAFADIGDYIDQPVRVYSSGMQARIAFSVATVNRPEILIIDEILSVGDASFQRKCFQRIKSIQESGTSLLFVSHDTETIKRICSKAVFLHQGKLQSFGKAKSVCDKYEEISLGKKNTHLPSLDTEMSQHDIEIKYGDGGAEITEVVIVDEYNQVSNVIPAGVDFTIKYLVEFYNNSQNVDFGIMIKSVDGSTIYGTSTENKNLNENYKRGDKCQASFKLKGSLLRGNYYINVGVSHVVGDSRQFLHRKTDTLILKVTKVNSDVEIGFVNMFCTPSIAKNNIRVLTS